MKTFITRKTILVLALFFVAASVYVFGHMPAHNCKEEIAGLEKMIAENKDQIKEYERLYDKASDLIISMADKDGVVAKENLGLLQAASDQRGICSEEILSLKAKLHERQVLLAKFNKVASTPRWW